MEIKYDKEKNQICFENIWMDVKTFFENYFPSVYISLVQNLQTNDIDLANLIFENYKNINMILNNKDMTSNEIRALFQVYSPAAIITDLFFKRKHDIPIFFFIQYKKYFKFYIHKIIEKYSNIFSVDEVVIEYLEYLPNDFCKSLLTRNKYKPKTIETIKTHLILGD